MPIPFDDSALRLTVQDIPYNKDTVYAPYAMLLPRRNDNDILPIYGTLQREYVLRGMYRAMHNTLFNAAVSNLANEIAATPWQLYGKRESGFYQEMLQNAQFGMGWRAFCKMLVQTYCVSDVGVPVEIIGRGNPLASLKGRVEGLSILDPVWCELTGNAQYPLIYRSELGGYHRIHASRVWRITDSPQIDREFYGRGFSALSRYFGTGWKQVLMGRYAVEKMSDLPPSGLMVMSNSANFDKALRQYEADRQRDGASVYRNVMRIEAYDPSQPVKVEFLSFAQLPDGFDYDSYMKHDINMVALALGVDPQDIAPLTGQGIGSGQQSFILDAKSQRKTPGILLKEIETFINLRVLPNHLEFKFQPSDEEGEKREAETAQYWVNVANAAPLTNEQRIRLLAAKVQAIQDVITDKNGNILFTDDDVPPDDANLPVDDTTTEGTDTAPDELPAEDDTQVDSDDNQDSVDTENDVERAYTDVRGDYICDVTSAISAAVAGDVSRVRFGTIMRALLERQGRRAMLDGLRDGGVSADVLEGDDLEVYQEWRRNQTLYVANLGDAIYRQGKNVDPAIHAEMWANKSLDDIYRQGLLSADKNGMYEWRLGATEEHCKDCLYLTGQVHRLKDWVRKGWVPKSDKLACKGFLCDCRLNRVNERARGRLREHTHLEVAA